MKKNVGNQDQVMTAVLDSVLTEPEKWQEEESFYDFMNGWLGCVNGSIKTQFSVDANYRLSMKASFGEEFDMAKSAYYSGSNPDLPVDVYANREERYIRCGYDGKRYFDNELMRLRGQVFDGSRQKLEEVYDALIPEEVSKEMRLQAETLDFACSFGRWLDKEDLGKPRLFQSQDGKNIVAFGLARTPRGLRKWQDRPDIPDFLDRELLSRDESDYSLLEYLVVYQAMEAGEPVYLVTSQEELNAVLGAGGTRSVASAAEARRRFGSGRRSVSESSSKIGQLRRLIRDV